nr:MAG TPA: hypothetical protein [Caudoviricetes sp.]
MDSPSLMNTSGGAFLYPIGNYFHFGKCSKAVQRMGVFMVILVV